MNQQNDTPILQNSAAMPTLIAQADPAPVGTCDLLPYTSPILPINTALLHTGQLLFICGSSNNPDGLTNGLPETIPDGWTSINLTADFLRAASAVWDVNNGTFARPPIPDLENGLPTDLFCPGHSFLADGRLLVAGGTFQYDVLNGHPFQGSAETHTFDPITQQWTLQQPMAAGRWYPTLVTLGNGQVLAVSGQDQNGNINQVPEVYDPNQNVWNALPQTDLIPNYAHLFLLRDGRVFFSGGFMGANPSGMTPRLFTLPAFTAQEVPGLDNTNADQCASVLLPPAQDQRVMIIGGGTDNGGKMTNRVPNNNGDAATNRVSIVDLRSDNPTYVAAAPLLSPRQHVGAVLLPDHTVFVCGGSRQHETGDGAATLTAEIYNPATNTWTPAATAQYARLYHSNALLLPDGRVLTNGGNIDRSYEELHLEIYSPPYLSMGPRPQIQNAPQNLTYGQTIQIQTPQAGNIQWVSLIRPSAATHSCDTEQRLVDLEISDFTANTLTATLLANESNMVPPTAQNIAPPGWYMLFIVDGNGVPSVASWVLLN